MFGRREGKTKEKTPRKTNPIFYIIAGGYLIYLAYEIFANEMEGSFANLTARYALTCLALIALGASLIIWTMRRMYQAEVDAFEERGRQYEEEERARLAAEEQQGAEGGEAREPHQENEESGADRALE